MNKREKILAASLGVMFLGGSGYAAFTFVASPLFEKRKLAKDLETEVAEREETAATLTAKNKRLQTEMYKRSLPADLEVAKQEYSTALRTILRESKVQSGYTFIDRPADLSNVPQAAKGKPFYTKIAYTITISKIDIGTFMTFLKKFYDMNLLHQITQFTLKRDGTPNLAFDKRQAAKRNDLNVTLAIEAVILDGVPPRKTLFAAPTGTGAALGGMGLFSLENNAEVARGIKPQEVTRVLAVPGRNYADVITHDVFHGFVPALEVPPSPPPPPPPPIPVKKPDLSNFVKFNNLIGDSEGHSLVQIYDQYANAYYLVDVAAVGERQSVKVQKFAINSDGRVPDKTHPPENWLDLYNEASGTNRKFWVYGLDGDALIVGDRDAAPAKSTEPVKAPTGKGSAKGGKGGSTVSVQPTPEPKAAIMGGMVAAGPKVERFFSWPNGKTLKQIRELSKAEADPIVVRLGGTPAVVDKVSVTVPAVEAAAPPAEPKETAPMPRETVAAPVEPGK